MIYQGMVRILDADGAQLCSAHAWFDDDEVPENIGPVIVNKFRRADLLARAAGVVVTWSSGNDWPVSSYDFTRYIKPWIDAATAPRTTA